MPYKHKEDAQRQKKEWTKNNPDKIREYNKRNYLKHIKERLRYAKEYRLKYPDKVKECSKKSILKLKKDILFHYSQGQIKCRYCAEDRIECLSIDHIFNDGNLERKKIFGQNRSAGTNFYIWLKKNNYPNPEKYQILCMNCQWYKRFHQNWRGK